METTLLNNQGSKNNSVAEEKLYSLAMVEAVSGGSKEFIKKMILLFIDTIPKDVILLKNACASKDWAQVTKIAHKLKSTIDSMAIKSIQQDIRTMETNAKQQVSVEILPELAEKINHTINICIVQLSGELAG
ncbi:MAG TPA: Hpt domain-containing protein [Puia sp.]|jgi:HPt (histidine-containing phosphotransfer) domain-containing protein|nr:Hpt domain-containing protein [Puia sp.]